MTLQRHAKDAESVLKVKNGLEGKLEGVDRLIRKNTAYNLNFLSNVKSKNQNNLKKNLLHSKTLIKGMLPITQN